MLTVRAWRVQADTYGAIRHNNSRNVSAALLRSLFDQVDADKSGLLDREEVRTMVIRLGREVTEQEIDEAMAAMDEDKSGEVDVDEFSQWWRIAFPGHIEVELKDEYGWTALMHGAEQNHKQLHVKELLEQGADASVQSIRQYGMFEAGSTALDIARKVEGTLGFDRSAVTRFLEEATAAQRDERYSALQGDGEGGLLDTERGVSTGLEDFLRAAASEAAAAAGRRVAERAAEMEKDRSLAMEEISRQEALVVLRAQQVAGADLESIAAKMAPPPSFSWERNEQQPEGGAGEEEREGASLADESEREEDIWAVSGREQETG